MCLVFKIFDRIGFLSFLLAYFYFWVVFFATLEDGVLASPLHGS